MAITPKEVREIRERNVADLERDIDTFLKQQCPPRETEVRFTPDINLPNHIIDEVIPKYQNLGWSVRKETRYDEVARRCASLPYHLGFRYS